MRPNKLRANGTVRVIYPLGEGVSSALTTSATNKELAFRGLLAFPADVIAMRLRVANPTITNSPPSTFLTGAINFTGMWLGQPLFDTAPPFSATNPAWSGRFAAPPSSVLPSLSTNSAGTETVGNWVTDRSVLPRRGVPYGFSYGLLMPSNGQQVSGSSTYGAVIFGLGGGTDLNISTAAQVGAAHYPNGINGIGGGGGPGTYLDVRLEVVMASMPVVTAIGDSILKGAAHDFPCANFEGFFGSAGHLQGFAAQNLGVGGTQATGFSAADSTSDWRYQRLDWQGTPPDVVVLQHGYNDLNTASATDVQVIGYMKGIMDNVRKIAPRARLYLCTLLPASFPAGTKETYRQSYNAWVRSNPYGAAGVIDLDDVVNPAGLCPLVSSNVVGNTLLMANGDPHPLRAGHQRLSQAIPAFR